MSLTILNEKIFKTYEKEKKINSHYSSNKTNYRYFKDLKDDYNEDLNNYGKTFYFNFKNIKKRFR